MNIVRRLKRILDVQVRTSAYLRRSFHFLSAIPAKTAAPVAETTNAEVNNLSEAPLVMVVTPNMPQLVQFAVLPLLIRAEVGRS